VADDWEWGGRMRAWGVVWREEATDILLSLAPSKQRALREPAA
jgi:hypothetical protein